MPRRAYSYFSRLKDWSLSENAVITSNLIINRKYHLRVITYALYKCGSQQNQKRRGTDLRRPGHRCNGMSAKKFWLFGMMRSSVDSEFCPLLAV